HRRLRNPGRRAPPLTQPRGRPQHPGPEGPGHRGPGRSGQQRADQVRYHETPPNIRSAAGHVPGPATDEHRRRRTVPYAVKLAAGGVFLRPFSRAGGFCPSFETGGTTPLSTLTPPPPTPPSPPPPLTRPYRSPTP